METKIAKPNVLLGASSVPVIVNICLTYTLALYFGFSFLLMGLLIHICMCVLTLVNPFWDKELWVYGITILTYKYYV